MTDIFDQKKMEEAAVAITRGGIVAHATEAVYGLACNPFDQKAVTALARLKGRSIDQGFLLIAADFGQIEPLIDMAAVPAARLRGIQDRWPGPITFVFPSSAIVPDWVRGTHPSIALRVTAHPQSAALCNTFGGPLVSTSANPHGKPPAVDTAALLDYFPTELAAVLEGKLGGLAKPTPIEDAISGETLRS
ncbi:MAG TPA: Sua5/YciO/YrdC/YwlC family protein [Bordetella sp.]|nr:Sua5/YciO/YrdC/YwlC family protein [Bordetella sp.]